MPENPFDLSNKVILVTGGTSGIGLACAKGFARAGARVHIWGRDGDKAQRALTDIEEIGGSAYAAAVDVASEAQVSEGLAALAKDEGRLDCVFVNAGAFGAVPSFLDLDSQSYHALLDINLHGAFYTLREAARHMVRQVEAGGPAGSIIVCGSLSVFIGVPGMQHYGAAKGALSSIMKGMALELGRYGIRVNMICPGYIKTRFEPGQPLTEKDQRFADSTPIPRLGRPEDMQGITIYLASDLSSFHTGDIIVVDGGRMVRMI